MEEENKVEETVEATETTEEVVEEANTELSAEEVVNEEVKEEVEDVSVSEEQPIAQEPVVEEPVSDPVSVQPVKRSKKDIIGYNPETGEPIYKEVVPGEIKPKKSKKGLIIAIIVLLLIICGVVAAILLLGGKDKEEEKELTSHEYREIVKDYGESVEKAISKYMAKEDEVPEFKDIKSNITYDKYEVSCKTVKINYDGTVYLADCSVDGTKIKKTITYGEEKEEPVVVKDNVIYFYKDNGNIRYTKSKDSLKENDIIAEYECEEDTSCSLVSTEDFTPGIMSTNMTFISELSMEKRTEKIVLYDIENKKVIDTFVYATWMYEDDKSPVSTDGKYILVSKNGTDYGIIDKDGKLIHDYNFGRKTNSGANGKRLFKTTYSIDNDLLVVYNDDKFGITKLLSNDVVIEAKYEDIKLCCEKYFKVKENGKWYLISFETKEKVLSDGYDFVFGIYNDTVVVANDKKIYIKDLDENDLLDTPIEVTSELKDEKETCCGNTPGASVKAIDDKKIGITVYTGNYNYNDKTEYTFDTTTKTLEK